MDHPAEPEPFEEGEGQLQSEGQCEGTEEDPELPELPESQAVEEQEEQEKQEKQEENDGLSTAAALSFVQATLALAQFVSASPIPPTPVASYFPYSEPPQDQAQILYYDQEQAEDKDKLRRLSMLRVI